MAKSYNINKSLTFSDTTGYWTLSLEVTSSSQVSPFPFLLEKAVLGTDVSDTLATSNEEPQYIRTLLEAETATTRLITDDTTYNKFTWVQYRSNSFSKTFYTYEKAEEALGSILSILKSNARIYSTIQLPPRLIAVNLSSKQKEPVFESIELTKGDTISLQLINGPTDCLVISDGDWITVSKESSAIRRKSNSHVITVTSDSMTYLGLRSTITGSDYKIDVSMGITPLEGTTSEIIR